MGDSARASGNVNMHDAIPELSYTHLSPPEEANNEAQTRPPIVFLHGLSSCHLEFSRVTPFLAQDYNLYLVDLPGHSGSRNIPFTLDTAIATVSHLITTKIPGGKAHVVSMSLGGHVALELAYRHPDLFLSLFCTGCAPLSGFRLWFISRPRLLGGFEVLSSKVVKNEWLFWAPIGVPLYPELRVEMQQNGSMETLKMGYGACTEVTEDKVAEIHGVRVAIVAGGKRDDVEQTRKAGKLMGRENQECRAFVVKDAVHLWDLQLPELFAKGVRAWVERKEMPTEFEELK
ncbi:Alpha/Beta hydrolase protein [Paraphoma chrysanthemicola]|uniref:Alpha/Beta hydrolase protein n=1 Tax=Paraphoma chrysanthemicola TaxID=798071 RepID=A0A8K0RIH6_9PLEO|nr:Alpha/Beta hydrolase protein [Paraphoma chrysanthemicola]